jgi:hypothetical protein
MIGEVVMDGDKWIAEIENADCGVFLRFMSRRKQGFDEQYATDLRQFEHLV